MPVSLTGFVIRPPRDAETAHLAAWFTNCPLGQQSLFYLAAFSQPADIPLGAIAARLSSNNRDAHTLIHVDPQARRRKIGSTLFRHFYQLALKHDAQRIVVSELIHADSPANAFFRSVGMTPERSLVSYAVPIPAGLHIVSPIAHRFRLHPHLRKTRFLPADQVPLNDLAAFTANHFGLFQDQQHDAFQSGHYDLRLMTVALRQDQIIGAAIIRSRPDHPYVFLDLLLLDPAYHHGPLVAGLCHALGTQLSSHRFTGAVFEADPHHDAFATTFAKQCAAQPQSTRHRYAIDRAAMQAYLASATPPIQF